MAIAVDKTISKIVENGLCTGCGTCVGICPVDAIEMVIKHKKGIYIPQLDEERCTQCGLCFEVCPGHAVDFKQLNLQIFGKEPDDILIGNYLNCYIGYATDYNIRYDASSGGMVTALLIFALEEGLIDGALVTKMREDRPLEPEPFIARTKQEIISASKSKYCPVPANIALKEIIKAKAGERFAVVGLPCHIHGIRKAQKFNKKLRNAISLCFSIVCAHTDNFHFTNFTIESARVDSDRDVLKLDYRGNGWPGLMSVKMTDGCQIYIPYQKYMFAHNAEMFCPWRCLSCIDGIGTMADIAFADDWPREQYPSDDPGRSFIVSRSANGEAILGAASKARAVHLDEATNDPSKNQQVRAMIIFRPRKAAVARIMGKVVGRRAPRYDIALPTPRLSDYGAFVFLRIAALQSRRCLWRLVIPSVSVEHALLRKAKTQRMRWAKH